MIACRVTNRIGFKQLPTGHGYELLNGIAVQRSGEIVFAVGASNTVGRLSGGDTLISKYGGGEGMGLGKFKEPVGVFVSPQDLVFVADWHNHRVVILDRDLRYIDEFGHFGVLGHRGSIIRNVLGYLSRLASGGVYLKDHFGLELSRDSNPGRRRSIRLLAEGLTWSIRKNGGFFPWLRYILSNEHSINKPNGVVFVDDRIVVSQKDNRCLSVYSGDKPYRLIRHVLGPSQGVRFGRLGNICSDFGYLYVCDERENVVWKLDTDFNLVDAIRGVDSGTREAKFLPFSCCLLDERNLAVCGGNNFQVLDIVTHELRYCSESLGELHGIAVDRSRRVIYIASRSAAEVLTVTFWEEHGSVPA